jgi:uncharacterized protein (DUF433 family)
MITQSDSNSGNLPPVPGVTSETARPSVQRLESPVQVRDTGVGVIEILGEIARGRTYLQILENHPKLIMGDIMAAAQLARDLLQQYVTTEDCIQLDHIIEIKAHAGGIVNVSKVREEFPRAFMPWRGDEEARLVEHFKRGAKLKTWPESTNGTRGRSEADWPNWDCCPLRAAVHQATASRDEPPQTPPFHSRGALMLRRPPQCVCPCRGRLSGSLPPAAAKRNDRRAHTSAVALVS